MKINSMDEHKLTPPQKDIADQIHEALTESLKTITGGFINPLISWILPSFHQKLFDKWCAEVYLALIELQREKLSKVDIICDPEFISLLKECMIVASKTHQEEKHELLKRVLLNFYDTSKSFDIQISFVKLIDNISVSHLIILKQLYSHADAIKQEKYFSKIKTIIGDDDFYKDIPDSYVKVLFSDLAKFNLVLFSNDIVFDEALIRQSGFLSWGEENPNLPYINFTEFGIDFIEYISHKFDNKDWSDFL